jgi:hypothetical protein
MSPVTQQQVKQQNSKTQDSGKTCKFPTALDCGISEIVAGHLSAVMQLLSNDEELASYNFEMRSTKCLNTAVMMMYLMLGRRAIDIAGRCDSSEVRERRKLFSSKDNGSNVLPFISSDTLIANRLIEFLFRKERMVGSELNYILMTHSDMKFPAGSSVPQGAKEVQTFPGHVLVIERIVDHEGELSFNVYQSYLYHYDFAQHMQGKWDSAQQQQAAARAAQNAAKQNLTARVKADELRIHLEVIAKGFGQKTWTKEDTLNWEEFTHSKNAIKFEGRDRSGIHICHQIVPVEACSKQLEILSKNAFNGIDANLSKLARESSAREKYLSTIWGDPEKTAAKDNEKMVPVSLTNEKMREELGLILQELSATGCNKPSDFKNAPEWFPNVQYAKNQSQSQPSPSPSPSQVQKIQTTQQAATQQAPRQQAAKLGGGKRVKGGRAQPRGTKANAAPILRVEDGKSVDEASDFLSEASNKSLLLVHSTYCGHCHSLRDDFEDAAKKIAKWGTNVVDVNSQSLRQTSKKDNVILKAVESTQMMGVPHLVLLGEKGKVLGVYGGDRSSADLVSFATK